MSTERIKLSVILPCYNVAQYIVRAIDSILIQNYDCFEILVINDGSTDNLLEICKQWEYLDNFTLLTTENQGVAQARNEGLKIAKGEYIFFMDPDDFISEGMFKKIVDIADSGDFDAVHFGCRTIEEYRGGYTYDLVSGPYEYIGGENIRKNYLPKFIGFGQEDLDKWNSGNPWTNKEFGSVWSFIFKRSLLEDNSITFSKGITLSEDKFFISKVLLYAQRVCGIRDVYYNYIMRANGALVSSVQNFSQIGKDKGTGVIERGKLRKLAENLYGEDIFSLYIGTVVIGVLEIIVRGVKRPFVEVIKVANAYLTLDEVEEAYKTVKLEGLPLKFRIPAMMVKYKMTPLLVIVVRIADKMGVKLKAF